MDIAEMRYSIGDNTIDFIRDKKKKNLIFNTFTGSGKTTTVLKTIYESDDGLTWMYFAPTHQVIHENIAWSKVTDFYDYVHLESRGNLCLSKEYRNLAKGEINITPFCENFCTLKDTRCPYYVNLRKIREVPTCIVGVHAHIPTLLQTLLYEKWGKSCMFNNYDVIIIDEFPSSSIYNQISITKSNIDYANHVLELCDITSNESHVLRLVLDSLSLSAMSVGINHAKIHKMIVDYKRLDFKIFKEEYDSKLLDLILSKKIKFPPKNIIHPLIIMFESKPKLEALRWMIYKTETTAWHKTSIYLTISNIVAFKSLPIKVIALDGTANLETWKSVLGEQTESISFDIVYHNAYQLIGPRNPVSTILIRGKLSSSGMRLFEILKNICNSKPKNVLVCASMRIQKVLKVEFKKEGITNYEFATFFNLRSRNEYYEECDTCVIFHEPNIPPFQSRILKHVLGWDEDIIRKIHRDDEMKQGIGRLRQNILVTPTGRVRGFREIFVFSSTGYKRILPEARYMLYDDMLSYVRGGKKRLFFDRLKYTLRSKSLNKKEFARMMKMSIGTVDHVLNILEDDGVIKVEWGKIIYLKKEIKEKEFLIRVGRS